MFKNLKIGIKILLVVLAVSLSALLLISIIAYTQMLNLTKYSQDANIKLGITASNESKDALLNQSREYLEKLVREQAESANTALRQINIELSALAHFVEQLYAYPGQFAGKSVPFVKNAPAEILSSKFMLAPGVNDSDEIRRELRWISSAEYAFEGILLNNSMLDNIYIGTESGISYRYSKSNSFNAEYDPRARAWYKAAMENNEKTIWLDTYIDPYGKVTITCARAFKNRSGKHIGVIATDITLTQIIDNILALRIGINGYAFLLDDKSNYIAHPDYGKQGFNMNPLETATGEWHDFLQNLLNGKQVTSVLEIDQKEYYILSALVKETNWNLCISTPINEIIAPAENTKNYIESTTAEAQNFIRKTLSDVIMRFIVMFAVCTMLVIAFSYVMTLTITRPIEELSLNVRIVGQGNLDVEIPVNGQDEIGELGMAFNRMAEDLKVFMINLEKETAEKQRAKSELEIASAIQSKMMPMIFPHYSNSEYFILHSKMIPAKESGGDFYDFFWIDEAQTKIVLVIANSAGKGVAASLFMIIAKTLIKQQMLQTNDPSSTLDTVNKMLCEHNQQNMSARVFVCSLNLSSGELKYANAGHPPPLIAQSDNQYRFMDIKEETPLGVNAMEKRALYKTILSPGDKLYLYTGNLIQTMEDSDEQHEKQQFLDKINNCVSDFPEEFDKTIRTIIFGSTVNNEQHHDITTLLFCYTKKAQS
ncbi:MAG: SpoIIE family protein phosphatase [Spirochaetaceae bacterium]|nr:SpoIIE family protein phosphatase [Spirochaetaceae bacterium]